MNIPVELIEQFRPKSKIEEFLEKTFKEFGFKNYQEMKRAGWLHIGFEIKEGIQSLTINNENGKIEGSKFVLSIIEKELKKTKRK